MKLVSLISGLFLFGAGVNVIAAEITLSDKVQMQFCKKTKDCIAIEGRAKLGRKYLRVFAAKCPIPVCQVRIHEAKDISSEELIENRLRAKATANSVFLSTAGFYDRVGNLLIPDGLLISNKIKIQCLVPKIKKINGRDIYVGGVLYVDDAGSIFINRYKEFEQRHSLAELPMFAIQSPTILIANGKRDFGLGSSELDDRSAVGVGAQGEFLFFLALSEKKEVGKLPTYDALTMEQFADLIIVLAEELGSRVHSAINMEGYSYPFVLLPHKDYSIGLNHKKVMTSVFAVEEQHR